MSPRVIRRGAGVAFAASCAAYVLLLVVVAHPPFVSSYFDLKVYRGAAHVILHGARLYDTKINRSYFTYPPLAAVVFTPLAVFPFVVDKIIVTAINFAALVGLLWFALRLPYVWSRQRAG
jgi:alpha-1,2-mannosyltransferase